MRSIALFLELLVLLPIVLVRPFVRVILWSWISFMNPHRMVFGGVALVMPWAMLIFIATMQVSMVAYISGGSFLSLSYWDYYFTILVIVAATYKHVMAALPEKSPRWRVAATPLPTGLAPSRSGTNVV